MQSKETSRGSHRDSKQKSPARRTQDAEGFPGKRALPRMAVSVARPCHNAHTNHALSFPGHCCPFFSLQKPKRKR